jgi:hypothetical protein
VGRLVDDGRTLELPGPGVVRFDAVESQPGWQERFLTIEGARAFEVGNACGTCEFWFTRLEGANRNAGVTELRDALGAGLTSSNDPVVDELGALVGPGTYKALVVDLVPRPVAPGDADDYFTREQVDLWGIDGFWGLAHDPRVPYYRGDDVDLGGGARLFELVVPMYPPGWLNGEAVAAHGARLRRGGHPTAVSLSVLDVKQPADWPDGTEVTEHWCLAHYLLDGHHKMRAAALQGVPVRLLAFLAVDSGVASAEDIGRVLDTLARA